MYRKPVSFIDGIRRSMAGQFTSHWLRTGLVGFALLLGTPVAAAQDIPDPSVLSGSWYNPDRDLEGFEFQVLDNDSFLIIWYTYPGSGDPVAAKQAFILGVGTLSGNQATVTETIRTHGPVFGNNYNSNDLVEEPWGTLSVEFIDQDTARVDFDGEDGSGSTNVVRLSKLADPASSGSLPSGISAAWFDPQTNGQGWFVEILSATRALVYWFTYDANGNQAWNLGIGEIIGNSILIREALAGSGTRFGNEFDSSQVTLEDFGAYTLEFTSCDNGKVSWFAADGELSGTLPIQRLSRLKGFPCEGSLPRADGNQLSLMSNPTDPALARMETASGLVFDLFGARDGAGLPVSASGGTSSSTEGNWRLHFAGDGSKTEVRDVHAGVQIVTEAADAGTEANAIDPARATSVARWLQDAGSAAAVQSGGGTSSPQGVASDTATVNVLFCDAPAAQASVDYIVGDAANPAANPADPGYDRSAVFIVPAASAGGGTFEASLPKSAAALEAGTLGQACRQLHGLTAASCQRVSALFEDGLRPVCGELAANASGDAAARIAAFNSCEASYLHQAAFCEAFETLGENPDAVCDAATPLYREVGASQQDVWASARASHVMQPVLSASLAFEAAGAMLDFGTLEAGSGSGVAGISAQPASVTAGQAYQLVVATPCLTSGQKLSLQRASGAALQCTVNTQRSCTFNLQTQAGWSQDSYLITGPGGLAFEHRQHLQAGAGGPLLSPPELLSPDDNAVLANRCDAQDVIWTFEWAVVEGAESYGIEVANTGGYKGKFAFGAEGLTPLRHNDPSVLFDVTLDAAIESSETEDWHWRVWAVDESGQRSELPDAQNNFSVEVCPVNYAGMYAGDLMASGDIKIQQKENSTCTASTTMDLTAEAEILDGPGSWIAFEGSQETIASNPNPNVPPEDCEDNSGVYPVERFEVPLTVDGDTVTGTGQDDNFQVTVTGSLSESGLEIVFTLKPTIIIASGRIRSNPTLLPKVD